MQSQYNSVQRMSITAVKIIALSSVVSSTLLFLDEVTTPYLKPVAHVEEFKYYDRNKDGVIDYITAHGKPAWVAEELSEQFPGVRILSRQQQDILTRSLYGTE